MNIKELLEKQIICGGLYSNFTDQMNYILDFGDIPTYDKEDEIKDLITNLESKLKDANNILERLNTITHDNYEY